MITIKKLGIFISCTPSHKFPKKDNSEFKLIPFNELSGTVEILNKWNDVDNLLPESLNNADKYLSINTDDTIFEKFKGNIYCIGVDHHHTFIIRQKGTTWISGNSWVKHRFIDTVPEGKIYTDEHGQTRTYVHSSLKENKALLQADPTYIAKLMAMTEGNSMLRKAWIEGSWDLMIGGFFSDVWDSKKHVIEPFIPPSSWKIIRSFDWGSSRPWAVSYFFETNGEQPANYPIYFPNGSWIVIDEIYGWTGEPNRGDGATSQEIADRVLSKDAQLEERFKVKVLAGPADTSIWTVIDGVSIAGNMTSFGLHWTKAYKGAGSRISGWALMRSGLYAAKIQNLERPGLWFFGEARNHIRTLPMMQRDKSKPEDIDSSLEDHCFVKDTVILTDSGKVCIGDLVGKCGKVLSVNGAYMPFHSVRKTRESSLVKVTFSDNFYVICTSDHNFLTVDGMVEARYLFGLSCISVCSSNLESLFPVVYEHEEGYSVAEPHRNCTVSVINVEHLEKKEDVYCMTVDGTHSFAIENGVIVSNCMDSVRYGLARKAVRMRRRRVRF
jgi:hypothetical protein